MRILRPVRRGSSVRARPPALIVEEPVGGEAAVLRRQHHLAPIDLGYFPTVDVVAHLRAQQSLVRANLNNGAGVLAVHHHTQENNVGRCGRRCRRRGRLHDRRRGAAGGRRLGENSERSTIAGSCSSGCAATGLARGAAARPCSSVLAAALKIKADRSTRRQIVARGRECLTAHLAAKARAGSGWSAIADLRRNAPLLR